MTKQIKAVAVMVVIGFCTLALARPVKLWSYEEMLKEAEVVLVATGVGSKDMGIAADGRPESWVPMQTTFKPLVVLKGKVEGPCVVEHYRYADKMGAVVVVDGPAFVEFDVTGKTTYLLFLKREANGILTPVTGQMDPIDSVKIVSECQPPRQEAAK
jgi:hypothetical protein